MILSEIAQRTNNNEKIILLIRKYFPDRIKIENKIDGTLYVPIVLSDDALTSIFEKLLP